jgi:hypothetical protein
MSHDTHSINFVSSAFLFQAALRISSGAPSQSRLDGTVYYGALFRFCWPALAIAAPAGFRSNPRFNQSRLNRRLPTLGALVCHIAGTWRQRAAVHRSPFPRWHSNESPYISSFDTAARAAASLTLRLRLPPLAEPNTLAICAGRTAGEQRGDGKRPNGESYSRFHRRCPT